MYRLTLVIEAYSQIYVTYDDHDLSSKKLSLTIGILSLMNDH
jgi:hypothetical protein